MALDITESHGTAQLFRYVGHSYLLFYGPSGRKYRFSGHGAELAVDPRDRDFVRDVPNLREVGDATGEDRGERHAARG